MKKLVQKIKNKILPQKNIAFFDFPYILSNDYKEMSGKAEALESPILFGRPISSVRVRPDLFDTCFIELSFDFFDDTFLDESDRLISSKMGKPLYYDKSGRKIWEHNGITVINGGKETSYNVVVHSVIICFRIPFVKKYPYRKWEKLEALANKTAEQWKIPKHRTLTVGGRLFILFFETEDYHYNFTLMGKKLRMNSYRKELQKGFECPDYYTYKPDLSQKTRARDFDDFEMKVNSFFSYLEEYDKNLENAKRAN